MSDPEKVSTEHLQALGVSRDNNQASYIDQESGPDASILESFDTPPAGSGGYLRVEIEVPEFTSKCPITGQPDFATIKISYKPRKKCLESKSLKLYVLGFRNHGSFHEEIVATIGKDLCRLLEPEWLDVVGEFMPRGGISFHPTFNFHSGWEESVEVSVDPKASAEQAG